MKAMNELGSMLGLIGALALGACAAITDPYNTPDYGVESQGNSYSGYSGYSRYGVVQSIEPVNQDSGGIAGSGIGLGTIAGAVVGGVVGNQVGSGRGNTAATVIGAAGGAYIGHQLENRQQQNADAYKITVRMEDGSYETLTQSTNADFRVGDRVRVGNGAVQRY
jgi:outer membrane lipoprotein SlyB